MDFKVKYTTINFNQFEPSLKGVYEEAVSSVQDSEDPIESLKIISGAYKKFMKSTPNIDNSVEWMTELIRVYRNFGQIVDAINENLDTEGNLEKRVRNCVRSL